MKRKEISLLLAGTLAVSMLSPAFAQETQETAQAETAAAAAAETESTDREDMPRVIITTDLEVDDLNSVIHLALYSNEIDLDGWVVSASQYHWNGDGEGTTLGEAVKSYRCQGERIYAADFDQSVGSDPDPAAADLTSYRPIPIGWLENLWDNQYREAYEHLSENDPNYPTPEYMLSITKYGNYEFEGDVRYDTEGSDLIKEALLDDDMRPLYIESWGGVNTTVRALLSIAEEYQDTDQWEQIRDKVCQKARIAGTGQDNSWEDNNIAQLYPDLVTWSGSVYYAGYGIDDLYTPNADPGDENYLWGTRGSAPDVNETFSGEWMRENILENHGSLMAEMHTFLDGKTISQEPMIYQLTKTGIHDMRPECWTPRLYEKNDWIAIGDSSFVVPLLNTGLSITDDELENGRYGAGFGGVVTYTTAAGESSEGNTGITGIQGSYSKGTTGGWGDTRFLAAIQEDLAARADWCVMDYDEANHAPELSVDQKIIYAQPGEGVSLNATASDPDGDRVYTSWWIYPNASQYAGEVTEIRAWRPESLNTGFTVPWDAQPGDYFNFVIEGRDDDASAPMTRYAQIIVKVVEQSHVDAYVPVITTAPKAAVIDAGTDYTMTVEAESSDGGQITYQWYTYDPEVSGAFYAIEGATGTEYTANLSEPGDYYYYVAATNTIEDNGDGGTKSKHTVSHMITVTVQ